MIDDFVIEGADPAGARGVPGVDPRAASGADASGDAPMDAAGDAGEMPQVPIVRRIVSGVELGVERGALDAAIALEIDFGGWTRLDRREEDGEVPEAYAERMREAFRPGDGEPARLNARDSDGILILARAGAASMEVERARRLAVSLRRPRFLFVLGAGAGAGADSDLEASSRATEELRLWLRRERIVTLCVLGDLDRGEDRGEVRLGEAARDLLVSVLAS